MSGLPVNDNDRYVKQKSWNEFRATGLLWFINSILHLFGWVICVDTETNTAFPARTKFRGFDVNSNDSGYKMVTEYLRANIENIYDDGFVTDLEGYPLEESKED